jgi:hypothetical protein
MIETRVLGAAVLAGLAAALIALPAAARPYLMLDADDHGFSALDLGGIDRSQPGLAEATVIQAPLAGVEVDGRLAPLVERRVAVDCARPWWRVVSTSYADGQERVMGKGEGDQAWTAYDIDDVGAAVQAAACRREYRQQAVSRFLNLGEILANYQAAHAKAKPEPPTEKELLDQRFKNGH